MRIEGGGQGIEDGDCSPCKPSFSTLHPQLKMAIVWIPSLMRSLANGAEKVTVSGTTLGEVLENLDKTYPGLKERLFEEGRISPTLTIVVDGEMGVGGLHHSIKEQSEIHFIPVISGGCC